MILLYNIFLCAYAGLLCLAAPFHRKARLFVRGRAGQWRRMRQQLADRRNGKPIVHFHCASTGEFEQGRPIMEELKRRRPNVQILLTFFSPSGFEACRNAACADYVFYLPLDFWWNARRFVRIAKPAAAVFVKYEYWHYHLKYLRHSGAKCYLASAILRRGQPFFLPLAGKFFCGILRRFHTIFVQNEDSRRLAEGIGIQNVVVSGDTRFDRVAAIAAQPKPLPALAEWAKGRQTLAAGSTWQPDEELLAGLAHSDPDWSIIFVPHELHEGRIQKLMDALPKPAVRYSRLVQNQCRPQDYQYVVVDCMGILSSVYGLAQCAYVGGGFGRGIHNILEAAAYGVPVLFGANYGKFREANDLIALGGAFFVNNLLSLQNYLKALKNDNVQRQNCGEHCRRYVLQNTGATQKICNLLNINDL